MAWHSVVAGACLVLGAVDVVWLGSAAEEAFAAPTAAPSSAPPTPTPTPDPIPIPISRIEHDTRSENSSALEFSGRADEPPRGAGAVNTFTIHFGRDEDTLGDVERAALDELAPTLTGAVSVEGHADEHGTDDHNLELSRRRAEHVAEYLAERGVRSVNVRAFGESKPLGSPHLDRRVEIHQEQAP
ncbi:MAG TPA: OmpA family protein [Kofleriaceae bacterium]|nr:OmpA family protein [Kofleriaceae bacterium]